MLIKINILHHLEVIFTKNTLIQLIEMFYLSLPFKYLLQSFLCTSMKYFAKSACCKIRVCDMNQSLYYLINIEIIPLTTMSYYLHKHAHFSLRKCTLKIPEWVVFPLDIAMVLLHYKPRTQCVIDTIKLPSDIERHLYWS